MLWDEQCQQETTRSQDYWKQKSAGKEAVVLKMSHEHKIAHMTNIALYDPATENYQGLYRAASW